MYNLFINPWRLAFVLILFSNIVFHSSPAFLLFIALLGICVYIYFFLNSFFNQFFDDAIKTFEFQYWNKSNEVYDLVDQVSNWLTKMVQASLCYGSLISLDIFNMLGYSCNSLIDTKTYLVVILRKHYFTRYKFFIRNFYYLRYRVLEKRSLFIKSFFLSRRRFKPKRIR